MTERNWKLKSGQVYSSDPYYDATLGGYIRPHDILEDQELAAEVSTALKLVQKFLRVSVEEE